MASRNNSLASQRPIPQVSMYHTFQVAPVAGPIDGDASKPGRSAHASRRISTSNACMECRRRKIRCDGLQPCNQCEWYQHPQLCTYAKPTQRMIPSKKLVDKLQSQVDQLNSVCTRLFPGMDWESLLTLTREELINLALTIPSASNSSPDGVAVLDHVATFCPETSDGAESLDALDQAPDHDPLTDEAKRHRDIVQGISDDVNGLSLSVDKPTSYVGVSSISAALKVIFKVAPIARPLIAQTYSETAQPSRSNTPPPQIRHVDPYLLPSPDVGSSLIESFFSRVHTLMPMIDEGQFWNTYLYGERRDCPWLALLNMVLALGSLASATCDNDEHIVYYQRSRKHLDMEMFGSGNLLVLQALGLLSGYYLHWLNRPNEANSLMGAALRMATALGLHREYNETIDRIPEVSSRGHIRPPEVAVEIRRRTWWSLYCLDTWASMTTGRPSLGRTGSGITVQSPTLPKQMNNAEYLASLKIMPIVHNIAFCRLATRIQDKLADRSLLKHEELVTLDAELVHWHDDLPPILRDVVAKTQPHSRSDATETDAMPRETIDFSTPPDRDPVSCPEVLKTPRAIMHWWYMTMRMLIHRPYLLASALRRVSYSRLSMEERVAVSKCRFIAGQMISDINVTCERELIAGWNAVWIMYQAVMVPLVSLFTTLCSESSVTTPSDEIRASPLATTPEHGGGIDDVDRWRGQIQVALSFFDRMSEYSVAAKKSKDVVSRLFEASRHIDAAQQRERRNQLSTAARSNTHGVSTLPAPPVAFTGSNDTASLPPTNDVWNLSPNGAAAMNSFWDDMMWDTFPDVQTSGEAQLGFTSVESFGWQNMIDPSLSGHNADHHYHWADWPNHSHCPQRQ